MKNSSYVELCLNALPPEKQASARQAFKDLLEGAPDDSMLSRLLIVLEATAAYGRTIPAGVTAAVETGLSALDARLSTLTQAAGDDEARRRNEMRELLEKQLPAMAAALSVKKHAEAVEALGAEVGRLERSVARMRHARVGGILLVLIFGGALGAGGIVGSYWNRYTAAQSAHRFVRRLNAAGISAEIVRNSDSTLLKIDGPTAPRGTVWRKNDAGYIAGADFVFPREVAP